MSYDLARQYWPTQGTQEITLRVPAALVESIRSLLTTGLYGVCIEEAAERLLAQGIQLHWRREEQ